MKEMSYEKMFLDVFKRFSYKYSAWNDFLYMSATALANLVKTSEWRTREDNYMMIRDKYSVEHQRFFGELLALTFLALEENPHQDFLGVLYHKLKLEQQQKGQFFTPYNICELMSEINFAGSEAKEIIAKQGYISVSDPACGAGAMLIAFANVSKEYGIDYQDQLLMIAQDIDRTAALMCYIQLSLIRCPAIVIIGDSLVKPGFHPDNEIWHTPTYLKNYRCFQSFFKETEEQPEQEIKKIA